MPPCSDQSNAPRDAALQSLANSGRLIAALAAGIAVVDVLADDDPAALGRDRLKGPTLILDAWPDVETLKYRRPFWLGDHDPIPGLIDRYPFYTKSLILAH